MWGDSNFSVFHMSANNCKYAMGIDLGGLKIKFHEQVDLQM